MECLTMAHGQHQAAHGGKELKPRAYYSYGPTKKECEARKGRLPERTQPKPLTEHSKKIRIGAEPSYPTDCHDATKKSQDQAQEKELQG